MLRDLMCHEIVAVDATYTADADFVTGMGVVKDLKNKVATLPTTETGTDILFVQKQRIPTGVNAGRTTMSDYDPDFVNVSKGDKVVLTNYSYDNILGTDQFADTLTNDDAGKYVAWGTDGKAKVATVDSCYKFLGFTLDAGKHKLARIYKTETVGKNA